MTTHCPIVFDYIVPVSKPRARKTNPQTSHDAAARVRESEAGKTRKCIANALACFGPQSVSEIALRICYDKVQIGKRINEVRGIAPTGQVRNGERVWGLI